MARAKKQNSDINKSAWFRNYLDQNPSEIKNPSSENVQKKWEEENPSIPWDRTLQQSYAAAKSTARKGKGARGRRRRQAKAATAEGKAPSAPRKRSVSANALEGIINSLDECVVLARTTLPDKSPTQVELLKHLHRARVAVYREIVGGGDSRSSAE
jgi:hypothetical protein